MTTRPTMWMLPGARHAAFPRRLATGLEATISMVQLAMEVHRGTWPSDDLFGMPWLAWMSPGVSDAEIQLTTIAALRRVPGVVRVRSVTITRGRVLTVAVSIEIRDEAGTVPVELSTTATPGPDPRLIAMSSFYATPSKIMPGDPLRIRPFPPAIELPIELPPGAYLTVDPLVDGVGTYSTSYTVLPDISGNGRHMGAVGTCGVSSTAYPVAGGGTQVLPRPTASFATMDYDSGSPAGFDSATAISWGPHDEGMAGVLGGILTTGVAASALRMKWDPTTGSNGELTLEGNNSNAIPDTPAIPWPARSGVAYAGSVDAWWVAGVIRARSGSTSTWTWIVIADHDDGAGVQSWDYTWSETTTANATGAGQYQTIMEGVTGARIQTGTGGGGKEAGGYACWTRAVEDDALRRGLVWAAQRFGTTQADAVAGILGV